MSDKNDTLEFEGLNKTASGLEVFLAGLQIRKDGRVSTKSVEEGPVRTRQ